MLRLGRCIEEFCALVVKTENCTRLEGVVEHQKKEYVKGRNHINGLEGFWGYLKRKLASKGGVKRGHPYLFLGEYIWRYNHRKLNTKEKVNHLMKLLEDFNG